MHTSYFKVALRYIKNHFSYSLFNLLGLTLGFFCFLILNAYISGEKNFDTWHGNVYRVIEKKMDAQGSEREIAPIGPRIGYAAAEQFPEIDKVTEIIAIGRVTVGNDPGSKNYEPVSVIDKHFFEVFNFKFIEGNTQIAFSQPMGVILNRSLRAKYFGNESALGKTLQVNDLELIVAAVIQDLPVNTHLKAGLIFPEQTAAIQFNWWSNFVQNNWDQNAFNTYFKLTDLVDIPALGRKITRMVQENWPADRTFSSDYILQDIREIHLYTHEVEGEINKTKGNVFYLKMFFWIALLIVLVASFNYTGLLNVSFLHRSREIGVRKTLGAGRVQLVSQFVIESLLMTVLSMSLAIILLQYAEPYLPSVFGDTFSLKNLSTLKILSFAGLGLLLSLSAVLYPIYLISRWSVVKALNDKHQGRRKLPFRRMMTMFQFIVAITLISCTLILYRQVTYLQNKELGFKLSGMLVIDINSSILRDKFAAVKQEFSNLPEVNSVCVSSRVPGEWKHYPEADVVVEGRDLTEAQGMIYIGADQDFLPTFGVNLSAGKNFEGSPGDSLKVLLNQSAVSALQLKDPVGQWIVIPQVNYSGDIDVLSDPLRVLVCGVVDDFHFEDFKKTIKPMVIGYLKNPIQNIDYYSLNVTTSDWSNTIAALRRINDRFDPNNPLEYNILNDQFKRFYERDILRSRLLFIFSMVVILIACLGLIVMTAFTLKTRTKEIGIRKVLGARIFQIVHMIAKDYLKIVLMAGLIAIPIAWFTMHRWLEEFAFRTSMRWWIFLSAFSITLIIAFIVVGFQSIRAAKADPVSSLQSE